MLYEYIAVKRRNFEDFSSKIDLQQLVMHVFPKKVFKIFLKNRCTCSKVVMAIREAKIFVWPQPC